MLSNLRAGTYLIPRLLPVNGRHLRLSTYPDSDSIATSLSVLSDPENMGKAAGTSVQSFIRAEINVISYLLPVNGHHL